MTECPAEWEKAQELSRQFETLGIEGKWALRREGGDATRQALFGGPNPAETVDFTLVRKRLLVSAMGWNGSGEFDGRTGYYETAYPNGTRARTEIVLDEAGVLHGKVRGSGVFEWDFVGRQSN